MCSLGDGVLSQENEGVYNKWGVYVHILFLRVITLIKHRSFEEIAASSGH